MSVLRYINNSITRFHTFVANRIAVIRDGSEPTQWRYVDSKQNPADDASRGLSIHDLIKTCRWKKGPEFLARSEHEWPRNPDSVDLEDEDPEVKKQSNAAKEVSEPEVMSTLFERYSDWTKLWKTVAWIKLAMSGLQEFVKHRAKLHEKYADLNSEDRRMAVDKDMKDMKLKLMAESRTEIKKLKVTNHMLQDAEDSIIKCVQRQHFSEEMTDLQSKPDENKESNEGAVKRSSSLYKLDPCISEGILSVKTSRRCGEGQTRPG